MVHPDSGRGGETIELNGSVRRLIDSGTCSYKHVNKFLSEAKWLSSPETTKMIRNTERLFSMMGDSNRIKMLVLLSKEEMCVCEIQQALGLPQPTVSHHLTLLEQFDLVEREKRGKWAFYRAKSSSSILKCLGLMIDLGRKRQGP
ncbi:MAG: winged helix-turn-helix transcriptional regulator [Nitrososphaerota archaeon]|jgi:DNA-binding transcriptional ArsR family regulator|nr:winged helix-turn-helix transcriptional regulator [Nitrososphaerota archaeon]MDG7039493.1 winged helix-turn-helix transcriptional regulator [Nitrososphaerota archaeon]MDG7042818.1 winged helix-turn-helix transcriptional regulator [Nitrososphaerota archaeon]MDG7045637.1 winged helix-turn-helix transcriptional regulator [Nitrososphaerota archaeon]